MWGTIVDRDGVVCAVAFTGNDRGAQWPGSRVISAQKANTANAFSLPAPGAVHRESLLGGAARRQPVRPAGEQPGGYRRGVRRHLDELSAQDNDPMVGNKIGGVNVFGGGLALYNATGTLVGARRRERRHVLRRPQHRVAHARHR